MLPLPHSVKNANQVGRQPSQHTVAEVKLAETQKKHQLPVSHTETMHISQKQQESRGMLL